jgi:YidC/Oxa1 family membrane protein insertase
VRGRVCTFRVARNRTNGTGHRKGYLWRSFLTAWDALLEPLGAPAQKAPGKASILQELDRNSIIGFVLLGVLMVVYLTWSSRQQQAAALAEQQRMDSLARVEDTRRMDSIARANALMVEREAAAARGEDLDSTRSATRAMKREERLGVFAGLASGAETKYVLSNEQLELTFSNRGGRLVEARLLPYRDFRGDTLTLFKEDDQSFQYSFFYEGNRRISTDSLLAEILPEADGQGVRFRFDVGDERTMDQVYRFGETPYTLDYDLEFNNFGTVIPVNQPYLELGWDMNMRRQEKNLKYERQMAKASFRYMDGETDFRSREGNDDFNSSINWLSYVDQFFNATLIADEGFRRGGEIRVSSRPDEDTTHTKLYRSRLFLEMPGGGNGSVHMRMLLAPNHYRGLKKLDLDLERIVPAGRSIIRWCNVYVIIPLFHQLSKFIGSYGLIILILTLIIKLALSPLTYRSYVSMAKMRVLKPEMDAIKEKYGDDQAKMSQETMKLYQQTGVSPLGGCLPMVLQMPILFAMYRFFPNSIELRQESFLWADDLSSYDVLFNLPFEIPFYGAHVSGFTLAAGISSIAYARMNSQMTAQGGAQMQIMQYLFPIMMLFIFNNFSSALTFYYFLSNVITFGQQWGTKRFLIDEDAIHAQIQENKGKPKKKSKWAQRLEAYAKAQEQAQRSQKKGKSGGGGSKRGGSKKR